MVSFRRCLAYPLLLMLMAAIVCVYGSKVPLSSWQITSSYVDADYGYLIHISSTSHSAFDCVLDFKEGYGYTLDMDATTIEIHAQDGEEIINTKGISKMQFIDEHKFHFQTQVEKSPNGITRAFVSIKYKQIPDLPPINSSPRLFCRRPESDDQERIALSFMGPIFVPYANRLKRSLSHTMKLNLDEISNTRSLLNSFSVRNILRKIEGGHSINLVMAHHSLQFQRTPVDFIFDEQEARCSVIIRGKKKPLNILSVSGDDFLKLEFPYLSGIEIPSESRLSITCSNIVVELLHGDFKDKNFVANIFFFSQWSDKSVAQYLPNSSYIPFIHAGMTMTIVLAFIFALLM